MEIWQTIIQLILLPTSIVAVLAFVMREFFKSYLSKDIEKYKSQLQSDLESFKIELQSNLETQKAKLKAEYDLRHFEFQTKFSRYHQQRAEVIEKIYELLSNVRWRVENLTLADAVSKINDGEHKDKMNKFYEEWWEDILELKRYYEGKRLYLSEFNCAEIDLLNEWLRKILIDCIGKKSVSSEVYVEIENYIKPTMKYLEDEFRQSLSAENPNNQLEKK